jgi:hypothetical protein
MPVLADAAGDGTPIWVTILVAVIAVVGPYFSYTAAVKQTNVVRLSAIEANSTANRAVEQARDAAAGTVDAARQANAVTASKSNRELIITAIEWSRSPDALTREQG